MVLVLLLLLILQPGQLDVSRDVTVNVKYKSSKTYKTITLTTVKEKELLDMTNPPDISLMTGYNPNSSSQYYPLKQSGTSYVVTTFDDNEWYDYNSGKYAILGVSADVLAPNATYLGNKYVWIPRFVDKVAGTGPNVQFLYGTSNSPIVWRTDSSSGLAYYGLQLGDQYNLKDFVDTDYKFVNDTFSKNDGKSGYWYNVDTKETGNAKNSAEALNSRIKALNITIN